MFKPNGRGGCKHCGHPEAAHPEVQDERGRAIDERCVEYDDSNSNAIFRANIRASENYGQ